MHCLRVSRLDAGVVQPKTEPFALQDLLYRVVSDCATEAASKGIELRVRPSRLGARSDPVLVEQVLRNLVNNAIRYTDRGKVLVGCRLRGAVVSVEVWYPGIGIPEEKKERIFDEFYQAAERDRREGLGLGLAIRTPAYAPARCETLRFLCCGARFGIQVRAAPMSVAPGKTDPSGIKSPQPLCTLTDTVILVMTMSVGARRNGRSLAQPWGVRAVKARSLSCVLVRLPECERYPDAIVSDFRLGEDQSGIDAVQRIRHELGLAIPALIVTGRYRAKSLRAIQASGLGCLPKPVTADRLPH